jgi:hypothetical protein
MMALMSASHGYLFIFFVIPLFIFYLYMERNFNWPRCGIYVQVLLK